MSNSRSEVCFGKASKQDLTASTAWWFCRSVLSPSIHYELGTNVKRGEFGQLVHLVQAFFVLLRNPDAGLVQTSVHSDQDSQPGAPKRQGNGKELTSGESRM